MTRSSTRPRLACLAALAASMFLGGCYLDRTAIAAIGSATPREFCPGDEVTASFDFLRDEPGCPAGFDCTPYLPVVDIDSAPASFAPQRFTAYQGSVTFVPAADEVDVTFRLDRSSVLIPTDRFEDGMRVFVQRDIGTTTSTVTVRRIDEPVVIENVHGGMCAGATPVHATVELYPSGTTPGLKVDRFCNASGVPIIATLSDVAGATDPQTLPLGPGECMEPASDRYTIASVRPQFPSPGVRCGSLDGGMPPPPLQTTSMLVCR